MNAAIFDMDGLLIDSEPLWRLAEQQVFETVGLSLSDDMCRQTMGYRIDETIAYWYQRQPWRGKSLECVEQEMLATMMDLVAERAQPMAGVSETLELFARQGFSIALASSSPDKLIDSVLRKLGLEDYFEVCCSAMREQFGKPNPAVYLSAARRLGVSPCRCIAFEDSVAGLRAAKAAGMITVAVPAPEQLRDQRFDDADLKLESLRDFRLALLPTAGSVKPKKIPLQGRGT